MYNCSSNEGAASAPVPWVGLYIALASLACCLFMAADLLSGIWRRKLHFPLKYFSLNSATLALLGVAAKIPGDLTTEMPGRYDQLSKLTGTALLCTAIANFMPSLVDMSASEMLSNTIAVVILVIPVAADVGIQMGTRVIYKFLPEHVLLLLLLLLLLLILCSAALSAGPTKNLLRRHFDLNNSTAGYAGVSVRESLNYLWVTAEFYSPPYVFGYSEACTAAGALSLAVAGVLVEALIRCTSASSTFCDGTSDYSWSTTVVLFVQAATVGVGTIAPACRWLTAVRFFPDTRTQQCRRTLFPKSTIWSTQRLREWQEPPLPDLDLDVGRTTGMSIWESIMRTSWKLRKFIIQALIEFQSLNMLGCYLVRFVSIQLGRSWEGLLGKRNPIIYCPSWTEITSLFSSPENSPDFAVTSDGRIFVNRLPKELNGRIQEGVRRQPTQLMELIQRHSTARNGFTTAGHFLPFELSSLWPKPPACWGLPIVTLATIVVCLPPTLEEELSVKSLLDGVCQGLKYIKAVDEYHPSDRERSNMSTILKVTERVWTDLYLYKRWLGKDLLQFRLPDSRVVLENLKTTARENLDRIIERRNPLGEETFEPEQEILACIYLYGVSNTILRDWQGEMSSGELFAQLRTMISDNMAACLTNLPRVIYKKCVAGSIQDKERNVRKASLLLGEVENILKFLEAEGITRFYPLRSESADEWRKRRNISTTDAVYLPPQHLNLPGLEAGALTRHHTVKVFTKADENYSLSIRDGKVVLVPSNPDDQYQHWIKDTRFSTKVKDEDSIPSFALVNKVTGQAIQHSVRAGYPVRLVPFNPDDLDKSVLWTESGYTDEGFRCIRMVNNIRLCFDAFDADVLGAVKDGTTVGLWECHNRRNQMWKIVPY